MNQWEQDILPLYLPGQLVEARIAPGLGWDFRGRVMTAEAWETETGFPWSPIRPDSLPVRIVYARDKGAERLEGVNFYGFLRSDLRPVPVQVGRGRGRPSLEW